MTLMSAPNEDTNTSSTFGANLFAGYNGPERQKFAEIESLAKVVLVVVDRLVVNLYRIHTAVSG